MPKPAVCACAEDNTSIKYRQSADTGIWFGTGYGTHPLGGYLVNYQGDLFVLLGITRELNDWVFLEINVGFWSDDLIGTSSALICLQL